MRRIALPQRSARPPVIDTLELINEACVVTFVTAWLDREAKSKEWQDRDFNNRQGDLFG